ncbi:flagellar protein [Parageobacillus genomosp. 1]|uniref:Flagellar protein FliT n=1 Tax=Parageobacillus genomosp. 1 TaxID=1295642 RepID=A0ABC9VAH2_9BACL|nr:flagellar protein FliT [Parageobacillus genomosp. 1]EZP75114.1 flagellar protein [Parageobacillus genomosp. 1]
MGVVHDLLAVTKELRDLVAMPITAEARDEKIATIERLLMRREELMAELRPPYSEEEQQLGRQIIAWNREIEEHLQAIKRQIQRDLAMIGEKRRANAHYTNPYEQPLVMDGMFYDKKR